MADTASVTLPEGVWDDICTYEAYRPVLSNAVRATLRAATATSEPRSGLFRRAPFRVLTMTVAEAEDLEAWLTGAITRTDAPTAAVAALIAIRDARYRALLADRWLCAECLASRPGTPSHDVQETLQRIAETTALRTDVMTCDRCRRSKVVHRIG